MSFFFVITRPGRYSLFRVPEEIDIYFSNIAFFSNGSTFLIKTLMKSLKKSLKGMLCVLP